LGVKKPRRRWGLELSLFILENGAELIGASEIYLGWEVVWFVFDLGLRTIFAQIWGLTGISHGPGMRL
jgi:hypothetical protein